MSAFIDQELEARGVSQVIVVVKSAPDPRSLRAALRAPGALIDAAKLPAEFSSLAQCFRSSELSQTSQLRAAYSAPGGAGELGARRAARKPGASRTRSGSGAAAAIRRATDAPDIPSARYYPNLGVMLGTVDRQGLSALRNDQRVTDVLGAPPLRLIRPRNVAAAKASGTYEWGLKALGIPELHAQGLTGKGIVVGHLDTGADGRHPALRGAILHFAEFDDFGREVQPTPRPHDTDDHGTHTAGTIAGRKVSGTVVGVAPGAKLASAIVIEGGDVVARVLGGMDWAVGLGVRVLSMSLGFPGYWTEFLSITQLLRSRGMLPVFAIGNEGPGTSRSPGNYAEALSVGACTKSGTVPRFSSSQRFVRTRDPLTPDLVAPGQGVVSAAPGGGWQSMDGTSMATPHVAGLAAVLMEAAPGKSSAQIEQAIFDSCQRGQGMPAERSNRGLPNGPRALKLLV